MSLKILFKERGDLINQLLFDYQMLLTYSSPVTGSHFTIKGIPRSDARQELISHTIELDPEGSFSVSTDSFGNTQIYGSCEEPHDHFLFHIKGEVNILQILYEEAENADMTPLFRHPHGLNRPGPAIRDYLASLDLDRYENTYEKSVMLMHSLHRDLRYRPGSSDMNTSAEEALRSGCGVCQDYAHIYIALSQLCGIPCRYVSGLVSGEGVSHAWVEVLYHRKWIGLDPTNDLIVACDHIKLSHGRDAMDCLLNRGIMKGEAEQTQCISAQVIKSV